MKMLREHKLPLADAAIALLKRLPREAGNRFVFVGPTAGRGLSNMAMDAVLQRMGYKNGRATVHGFRSTFRDWAAETTAHPNHVVEQALAHSIGSAVERAYRRGDLFAKRTRLMADWARFCAAQPARGNVLPLRRAGR
jgi:integrase